MISTPGPPEASPPLWRHRAFLWTLAVSGFVVFGLPLWQQPVARALLDLESMLAAIVPLEHLGRTGLLLIPAAGFGCGVLASVSPCILPLVPLNLAYIGASEADRRRALGLSSRFVLGSALALSVLGLFGDLAGFLLIDHRGPVLLVAGLAMLYFGLAVLELVPMPVRGAWGMGRSKLGPIGAGAAFSLITTPCSSPLLGAMLAAAAAQAVAGLAVVTLFCFSLGYTALVFLGGAFGAEIFARARRYDFAAARAVAAALLVASGVTFVFQGADWF